MMEFGGAKGNRTPDLFAASEALSQLSYGPERVGRIGPVAVSLQFHDTHGKR